MRAAKNPHFDLECFQDESVRAFILRWRGILKDQIEEEARERREGAWVSAGGVKMFVSPEMIAAGQPEIDHLDAASAQA